MSEPKTLNTRRELAKISGVSEGTLAKIEKVDNEAPAPIKAAMGKTISIDKAARFNSLLKDLPESERDAEAERLIMREFEEKEEQILREEKIAKVLCNIISAATINYEYLTAECVKIYLKKSPSSVLQLVGDLNHEIGLLIQLKELFLQAGGIQEEEDEYRNMTDTAGQLIDEALSVVQPREERQRKSECYL
ncbi:hypothetical protein FACS1894211_08480 [Clostridia bacterium]|nr:hypothetical protein FACS1894211_08480 [Clostridia bacterium]